MPCTRTRMIRGPRLGDPSRDPRWLEPADERGLCDDDEPKPGPAARRLDGDRNGDGMRGVRETCKRGEGGGYGERGRAETESGRRRGGGGESIARRIRLSHDPGAG